MALIEVTNISKEYPARRGTRLLLGRGGLGDLFRKQHGGYLALEDISLEVGAGESLGIIGRNGSGKSTLLKILAGVTLPSTGTVRVEGRVASLLELGAGFHPMLTGRENIYLNAGLLGMRAAQVDEVFDAIVEFSGIGDFIDQPVDTYSSGMYVRIAFSVAVHANPDIFLVDEVLAVGDEEFQRKCRVKIGELKEQGKTIVFVSHDLGIVHALCDRVALLHQGKLVQRDTPQQTIDFYLRQIGREAGIHSMSVGAVDAIFNHGKLSLFREQREVTGPGGIYVSLISMGQDHFGNQADWRVTDRGQDICKAEGRMPRLPIILHQEVSLKDGEVEIAFSFECLSESPLDIMLIRMQIPAVYNHWYLEDQGYQLPAIEPGDVDWNLVVLPDSHCRNAMLLPDATEMEPLKILFDSERSHALILGYNCDYISGSRIMDCVTHIPGSESPMAPGRYRIGTIRISLNLNQKSAQEVAAHWEARRNFALGCCHAHLRNGFITLESAKIPLSANLHGHVQVRVGGMWVISRLFQWSQAWIEDGWLHVKGTSARTIFTQHWMLRVGESGLEWRVLLETLTPVALEEYNISLGLQIGYQSWKNDHETGIFPDFCNDLHEWSHLNADFATGRGITASGTSLPTVSLATLDTSPAMRMTALNTGANQHMRILQALCTPERAGELLFEPGTHILFDGVIRVGDGG